MKVAEFQGLRQQVIDAGYGEEIVWSEELKPCSRANDFFCEYMWVVVSSGIKNQVARLIESRLHEAIQQGRPLSSAFGHKGKVKAIEYVLAHRGELFEEYRSSTSTVDYLECLPWIGKITKWHLAKNLGADTPKPDRHLVRIATKYGTNCFELCRRLAGETGYRVATVDLIIWRAANLGFI